MRLLYWGVSLLVLTFMAACSTIGDEEGAEAYYNLGNAYFELGRLDESKRAYERALELDSSLAAATYNLARLYIEQERYIDARKILLDLLQEDPQNTILIETLGWVAFRQGENETALERYRASLDLGPGNAPAWYNLGRINSLVDRPEEAIAALQSAVYYDPDAAKYRLGLAEEYYRQQNVNEAIDILYPSFADGSGSVELLLDLLKYLTEAEEYAGALEVADELLEIVEKRPDESGASPRAEILAYKALILLAGFEETSDGLELLRQALEGGYDEREMLVRFFKFPDIPGFDEVQRILGERGITPAAVPVPGLDDLPPDLPREDP